MEPEIVCDSPTQVDPRPEYYQYQDQGCELSGSCLQCRLSRCIYDNPRGKHRMLLTRRNQEIRKLFEQGKNSRELAYLFGLSRRTIQRVVKKNGRNNQ